MSYETESLENSSIGFKKTVEAVSFFNIRRNKYPEYFAGFNGFGPMWSSCSSSAVIVPIKSLAPIMLALSGQWFGRIFEVVLISRISRISWF